MTLMRLRYTRVLFLVLGASGVAAACGGSATDFGAPTEVFGADASVGESDATIVPGFTDSGTTVTPVDDSGPSTSDIDAAGISITPADAVITVQSGQAIPTIGYQAKYAGSAIDVKWSTSREELGTIDATTGVYTPKGTLGGVAKITAFYRGLQVTTTVTVKLAVTQNGDPNGATPGSPLDGGAGGYGGVGGEGPGRAATGPEVTALNGTPSALSGLDWLYPYDSTVFPRGILSPLMQWSVPSGHTLDAIRIQLSEANFSYDGTFAAPATNFIRHPIPEDVWTKLLESNTGEDVSVKITLSEGTAAYSLPMRAWKIASGSLKGTVYYNSYGTRLATNYASSFGNFGAATLSIGAGATAPTLTEGFTSALDGTGCRVCHSVAANGASLITNTGLPNDKNSVSFDIKTKNEKQLGSDDGRFSWSAISPDGNLLFTNAANLQGSKTDSPSALYFLDGGAAPSTGLPSGLKAGTPVFSPDGKHVAFNVTAIDAAADAGTADGKSLAVMDFDSATHAFSNYRVVFTPGMNGAPAGTVWYPSFLPTSSALVFHLEVLNDGGKNLAETRAGCDDKNNTNHCMDHGVRAELWWIDLKTNTPARLDKANGSGMTIPHPTAQYPGGGDDFATIDAVLNYEPTVGPVPSGGYAWMVFTSRRVYGNVATMNPYHSDPRYFDLRTEATTKKLWVAAIDLNATPGTDPSHAAFYLPAQEVVAANSRGYWVLDPCHSDGEGCATGDECCNGFCRQAGDGGALQCLNPPANTCAHEYETCSTTSDCCAGEGTECIGGHCSQSKPDAGTIIR